MKAEKVILSFVAVFVGLVAAGIAFYLYQSTRAIPSDQEQTLSVQNDESPSPTPIDTNLLSITSPQDEAVFDKKVITINGKTVKDATLIISTLDSEKVVKPADNGDFTLTQAIPDGSSIIEISAIFPDGTEKTEIRTVTFSTENF